MSGDEDSMDPAPDRTPTGLHAPAELTDGQALQIIAANDTRRADAEVAERVSRKTRNEVVTALARSKGAMPAWTAVVLTVCLVILQLFGLDTSYMTHAALSYWHGECPPAVDVVAPPQPGSSAHGPVAGPKDGAL